MDRPAIDARSLVDQLWREAEAARRRERGGGIPIFEPSDHLLHREDLRYLNEHHIRSTMPKLPLPEGGGLRGKFRRHVIALVRTMLERRLEEDAEFLAPLVRFENELARKVDRLEDEVRALAAGSRDEIRLLGERLESLHRLVEARLDRLEASSSR